MSGQRRAWARCGAAAAAAPREVAWVSAGATPQTTGAAARLVRLPCRPTLATLSRHQPVPAPAPPASSQRQRQQRQPADSPSLSTVSTSGPPVCGGAALTRACARHGERRLGGAPTPRLSPRERHMAGGERRPRPRRGQRIAGVPPADVAGLGPGAGKPCRPGVRIKEVDPPETACTTFSLHAGNQSEPVEGIRNRAYCHPRGSELP